MTQLRGRALVVDDRETWLRTLRKLLQGLGLEVMTARTYDDAIGLLENQYFHLAVIDMRLQEDDPNNTEGMDILSFIDHQGLGDVVAKIVITGYGDRASARQSFKSYNVYDFVPKQGPEGRGFDGHDFEESVKKAFEKKVGVNFDLEVRFVRGLSLDELVSQFAQDDAQAEAMRWEMDDLLRKLFSQASTITVSRVSGGHGKTSRVIKIDPFYEGKGQGEALLVKYGPVDEIEVEARNFKDSVKGFIAGNRHTDLKAKARTRSLSAIVYSLIGAPFKTVSIFDDFYRDNEATDICAVLDELFIENCRNWYDNRSRKRLLDVSALYWEPAGTTLEVLLQRFSQMYKRFVDKPGLSFDGIEAEFVNPLYHPFVQSEPIHAHTFVATTHGDLNGENLFVDRDNHVWMIDFYRTGEGHILRDFVTLESVIKFQLLDEDSLATLYEFEKAVLTPDRFADELPELPGGVSAQVTKALAVISHLRQLAGTVTQPSPEMRPYYAGLLYHTLNLIRYYHLLQRKSRKYYILLSAAMLCQKLERTTETP